MRKNNNTAFSMIADYDGDINKLFESDFNGLLPILATRNLIMFPGVVSPVLIGREISINLINKLKDQPDSIFALFCQKDIEKQLPTEKKDLFEYGVFAKILRVLELPGSGDNITVIVQALGRCKLNSRCYL